MHKPFIHRSLLIAPFAALLPTTLLADVDTSEWLCESCPFESGYRAEIEAGAAYVSDDVARFGNGDGFDDIGTYAAVEGQGSYASSGYRLDWTLENLGLDSRALEISGSVAGKFGFDIAYREMPYRRFDSTRTIFNTSQGNSLTLPSGWVAAGTTAGFTRLAASLKPQKIGSDRQVADLGAYWNPSDRVRVYADFRRQNREGYKITGGAGFTQSTLLPRWFDYETDQIDAGIQYGTAKAHIGLAYYGSFFTNNDLAFSWQTPFVASAGAATLQKSVTPGNDFQQFLVNGLYRATTWDTVIAVTLATGRGEQDETLLPYTINPTIGADALPIASLDAQIDTSNYALTITTRPIPKGRVRFTYRYDDRDNETLRSDWNRVIVDLIDTSDVEQNVPYSFERSQVGVSGELSTWKDIRISGGYDRKVLKRDFQEVAEQTIDAGWGQLRWQPLDWLDLRAKGGTSEREIDRYDEAVSLSLGQNPLLRKYNLAYRYREYGELLFSISPGESGWSLSSSVMLADDSYSQSQLGMTDSEELRATADLSLRLSDNASVYLTIGREEIEAQQLGSEQFGAADWQAWHEDNFDHAGFGMRWEPVDGKFDFRIDYNHAAGETAIRLDSLSGGQSALPDLESTLDSVRVEAGYRWTDRLYGTLDLRYEQFELSDWALVATNTLPGVLTLGAEPYDYDIWAVGLGIRYRFGGGATGLK